MKITSQHYAKAFHHFIMPYCGTGITPNGYDTHSTIEHKMVNNTSQLEHNKYYHEYHLAN